MKCETYMNDSGYLDSALSSPLLLPAPSTENTANRESWLNMLMLRLAGYMEEVRPGSCADLDKWRVSCGWPGGGSKRKRIGECWSASSSKSGRTEMFISPMLDEAKDIDHVLLHEMVHASVGTKCQHGGDFRKFAKALGLEGKMTATVPGAELRKKLDEILEGMPAYPHAGLSPSDLNHKKQTTRMKKCRCEECGYIIRTTQTWLDKGVPKCYCGGDFTMSS